jgi:hypothetical protein
MRSTAILAFTVLALVAGCGRQQGDGGMRIPDVTKTANVTLTTPPGYSAKVHGISVRVHGTIDGTAQISGTSMQAKRVSGRFEVTHSGDYYTTNFTLSYMPVGVRDGRVNIDYEFRSKN